MNVDRRAADRVSVTHMAEAALVQAVRRPVRTLAVLSHRFVVVLLKPAQNQVPQQQEAEGRQRSRPHRWLLLLAEPGWEDGDGREVSSAWAALCGGGAASG